MFLLPTALLEPLEEGLLPVYLLPLQWRLLGIVEGSQRNISLMVLRRRIQKFIWDSSKDFHYASCKLHQIISVIKISLAEVDLVYKGRLADGSLVAVKRLKDDRTRGGEHHFQIEVEMISMAVHRNLLRLRGFCMTPTERLLVYPYMANGSVASCLRERPESQPPLDWQIRKQTALGSARGLSYLHDHFDPMIIHRDVKAANILLDEDFEAVVGDFGLAELMDYKDTHVTTAVCGTIGHIAPEYLSTGESSVKTDVFGYGVMLLELITGQRAFDLARLDDDVMLLDWVRGLFKEKKLETLVDADLQGNYIDEEVKQLIQIALLCTQSSPLERPRMSEVVRMLEGDGLAERWEEWQKKEMFRQEFNHTQHPSSNWLINDSISNIRPDELSGPR